MFKSLAIVCPVVGIVEEELTLLKEQIKHSEHCFGLISSFRCVYLSLKDAVRLS